MVRALHRPRHADHGFGSVEVGGQSTDVARWEVTNRRGPVGGFGGAIRLPHHVFSEVFPTTCVGIEEGLIVLSRRDDLMDQSEDQRGVRPWPDRPPLAPRLPLLRRDGDDADAFRGQRIDPRTHLMIRRTRRHDLRRARGNPTEGEHQLTMLRHQRLGGDLVLQLRVAHP